MDPDTLSGLKQARWERYCQLSAAALVVYEYLIQLAPEFYLFWLKRWSIGKALFLWNRYYGLVFNVSNAIMFLKEYRSAEDCRRWFYWQNSGAVLQVITTHVVLELRLWAMYGSSKVILAVMIILQLAEATMIVVVFAVPVGGQISTNNPFPDVYICADADPAHKHWYSWYWTTVMGIEAILLGLAMYKAYQNRSTGEGGRLMRALSHESVLYFVGIFGIYVLNQVLWLINRITLNELATGFSFALSAIFANRLMISVRKFYYEDAEHQQLASLDLAFGESPSAFNPSGPMTFRRPTSSVLTDAPGLEAEGDRDDELHRAWNRELKRASQAQGTGTPGRISRMPTWEAARASRPQVSESPAMELRMLDFDEARGF